MNLLLALSLIGFEIAFEGLKIRKHHVASGIIEFVYRALITLIVFAWFMGYSLIPMAHHDTYLVTILGYLFLRFGMFDPVFNLVIGESINFVGSTKLWDRVIWWLCDRLRIPANYFIFIRIIFLCIGVAFLLGWRNGIHF